MSKITDLAAVGTVHSDDLLVDVDVHDTSMASTGTDKKLTVNQLATGMASLGLVQGSPLNPAGFSDNFAGITIGQLPSPQLWALVGGGHPNSDPTLGAQWYEDDVQNCFVDGSGYLNLVVTVNGGGTTTSQTRGNYVAPRLSTFIDRCGTNNGAQSAVPWSIARPGFTGFQATYGTLSCTARINTAMGFWPAIWVLGTSQHWPSCGEIDVIENFGGNGLGTLALGYGNVIGAANPSDYSGYDWQVGTACHTPANINDNAFHTYTMQISSDYNTISMKMDGTSYAGFPCTRSAWLAQASAAGHSAAIWPFGPDQKLGVVLNVCVGDTITPPPTGFPSGAQTFPFVAMQISSIGWSIP